MAFFHNQVNDDIEIKNGKESTREILTLSTIPKNQLQILPYLILLLQKTVK
jgi:hypothetical protein